MKNAHAVFISALFLFNTSSLFANEFDCSQPKALKEKLDSIQASRADCVKEIEDMDNGHQCLIPERDSQGNLNQNLPFLVSNGTATLEKVTSHVNFKACQFECGSNLSYFNLAGVSLRSAKANCEVKVDYADFTKVDLRGADLTHFSGLESAFNLDKAIYDKSTKFPQGVYPKKRNQTFLSSSQFQELVNARFDNKNLNKQAIEQDKQTSKELKKSEQHDANSLHTPIGQKVQ